MKSDLGNPLDTLTKVTPPDAMPTVNVKNNAKEESSLFIPYWTIDATTDSLDAYKTLIYFGVTPTVDGINTEEVGYVTLPKFIQKGEAAQQTLLTLRMLDSKTNFAILEDAHKQDAVISQFISLAKRNHFDGVILDLELSALPFDSVIAQINAFTKKLATEAHDQQLSMGMMMYGDSFYRVRPFEVKTLGAVADQLYIMAYDFSKAKGNPGPNFPLAGKETFGYDYSSLVRDFTQAVSAKKITVVFGMYGYDWRVTDKKLAVGQATALSTNKIEHSILETCAYSECTWERDGDAGEIKAEYDDGGEHHLIWFEDRESVNRKKEYLRKHGITSYSYWAHSYFTK